MLKEPRSQDICCYFRKDASLLGVLFAGGVVVVAAVGAVAAANASVARITYKNKVIRCITRTLVVWIIQLGQLKLGLQQQQ